MKSRNAETPYKNSLRSKIVKTATAMFHENGIRSVKMDDIANALSISKRTLYEIFETKELLLEEVVLSHDQSQADRIRQVVEQGGDVMDVIIDFYRMFVLELAEVSPAFFDDLGKYPKITNVKTKTREARRQKADGFMLRGIAEGYFRDDINLSLLHEITDAFGRHVMSASLYKQYPMKEIFRNLLIIIFRGLCTEKGVHRLDEFLKEL